MNIKIRRPHSCLGCSIWLIAAVVAFVVLSNVYAKMRLYLAHEQAMELAQQLGFTPDDFLHSAVYVNNVNIVTGSASCRAVLYFMTPLDLADFEAKLIAAEPGTWRVDSDVQYLTEIYYNLPLDIDGVSGKAMDYTATFPPLPAVLWFLTPGHGTETSTADLYLTESTALRLTYGNRQIEGNIAVIRWAAGRHQVWVDC